MANPDWLTKINNELKNAQDARARGNEGKARVCARRAAGWSIKEYLSSQGVELNTSSAFEHIQYMLDQDDTPQDIRRVLKHMTQRVEKDSPEQDPHWPSDVDLIAEAKWLIEKFIGEEQ